MNIDEQTVSDSCLTSLSLLFNADSKTQKLAKELLAEFKARYDGWSEEKSEQFTRSALFCANKALALRITERDQSTNLPVTALLQREDDLQGFFYCLKTFAQHVRLEDSAAAYTQRLINNYAFAFTIYTKAEEIWDQLGLRGEDADQLKEFAWYLFLLAKVNILLRRSDVVECTCMLLGVFVFVLSYLPSRYTVDIDTADRTSVLTFLCDLLKAHQEQVEVSASHLTLLVEEYKRYNILRGHYPRSACLAGLFSYSHLHFNTASLREEYHFKLFADDFDERAFIRTPSSLRVSLQKSIHRFSQQKVPNTANDNLWLSTRLEEVKLQPSGVSSPLSTTSDAQTWLDAEEPGIPSNLNTRLDSQAVECLHLVLAELEQTVRPELAKGIEAEHTPALENAFEVAKGLMSRLLSELVLQSGRELRSDPRDTRLAILTKQELYRALMACSLELTLFISEGTALEFEELLDLCKATAFDVWKLIKNVMEFDLDLPIAVTRHLQWLESRIVCYLIWDHAFVSLVKTELNAEVPQDTVKLFCSQLLMHCAQRVKELCQAINLTESVQEEVWRLIKHILTAQTQVMLNRHIDQIVLCSIYGVCKAMSLNLTVNTLILKYTSLFNDSGTIFRYITIDEHLTGDIISFYNHVFIKHTREFLLEVNRHAPAVNTQPTNAPIPIPSPVVRRRSPPRTIHDSPASPMFGRNLLSFLAESPGSDQDEHSDWYSTGPQLPIRRPPSFDRVVNSHVEDQHDYFETN